MEVDVGEHEGQAEVREVVSGVERFQIFVLEWGKASFCKRKTDSRSDNVGNLENVTVEQWLVDTDAREYFQGTLTLIPKREESRTPDFLSLLV